MNNLLNILLESESLTSASSTQTPAPNFFQQYGIWIIFAVFIIIYIVFTYRRNKKQQAEVKEKMNALKPGDKIETIGRIYGTIVEVNDAENTLVIRTGSEDNPGYVKVDKLAVYRTIPDEAMPDAPAFETETTTEPATDVAAENENGETQGEVINADDSDGNTEL